jgi:hypothetical protein
MTAATHEDTEALARVIHARNEFDYDDCQHGTFSGGHMHGEPYAMCERMAAHLLASDWLAAYVAARVAEALAPIEALAEELKHFDGAVMSNERFGEGFLTGLGHAADRIRAALPAPEPTT